MEIKMDRKRLRSKFTSETGLAYPMFGTSKDFNYWSVGDYVMYLEDIILKNQEEIIKQDKNQELREIVKNRLNEIESNKIK
jgi:hypothetical protein